MTRAPIRGNLFAVAMGIGAQVLFCWASLLVFFNFNLLAHVTLRPWIFYLTVLELACSGFFNGLVLGYVLRLFGREHDWKPVAAVSAVFFPLFCLVCIAFIDFFEWSQNAGEEFDFLRASASFILWLCIGIPTTYIGAAKAMQIEIEGTFK